MSCFARPRASCAGNAMTWRSICARISGAPPPALKPGLALAFSCFQRAAQGVLAPYVLLCKTARQLRRERYDLALNLRPDFWWGAALLYLAGIPTRAGYALQPGEPFLSHA